MMDYMKHILYHHNPYKFLMNQSQQVKPIYKFKLIKLKNLLQLLEDQDMQQNMNPSKHSSTH